MTFSKLSKRNARAFFDLYMKRKDIALSEFLDEVKTGSGLSSAQLDFSPDSLIPIWTWARKNIQVAATPAPLEQLPPWYEYEILSHPHRAGPPHFSADAARRIDGLSYYWGDIFVKNIPGVRWDIDPYPKSFYYCCPVVRSDTFEQYPVAGILSAARIANTPSDPENTNSLLFDWYRLILSDYHGYMKKVQNNPASADPRMANKVIFK